MLNRAKEFLFKNKTDEQTVAKNTFWLTVSNFGGRLIKAAVVVYGARVLGTEGWGVFSYALTLAGFFTLFIDPGINGIVMREVPKAKEEDRKKILATTFTIKICFILLADLFVIFVAPSFSNLPGARILLPIVALIITFDSIRAFFSSFIRAQEKMEWEAGTFLLTNLIIVILGFLFLHISLTPLAFGWAYAVGTGIGALMAAIVLWSYLKKVFSYFSSALIKPILTSAWPFAITGALGGLLTNTDILIISWMRSASDVGIYSAAIRIIQLLYLIPMIFQFSTLPLFARLANTDDKKFRVAFERTIGLIFLASIPIALGGAILGTQIMKFIFGAAYQSGGPAFKILMLSMIVDYPAALISTAIFAYNRQKGLIITSAIGGVANVLLDLALIPSFGILGSAFATLIAQILSNWYLWHMMKKINHFEVFPALKKIFFAGAIMALATVAFSFIGMHVVLNIILSAIIYFFILRILREPLLIEVKRVVFAKAVSMETPGTL